jgi:hypothetical protein
MIALAENCLVFELANGEKVPFSPEMICIELSEDCNAAFDPEFVRHAASAVFHYFKHDLNRETVSIAEFTESLERVLRGFAISVEPESPQTPAPTVIESDLRVLVAESGSGCELFFFPRLRDELRSQMKQMPRMLRFRGLRGCVKHLTGARRWSSRCQNLQERIVDYLRECLTAEKNAAEFSLLIDG